MMITNNLKNINMTNEYEMQNFWKQNKEEENYCFYSDLPSPLAYMELQKDLETELEENLEVNQS
jgi:hypothetical protein